MTDSAEKRAARETRAKVKRAKAMKKQHAKDLAAARKRAKAAADRRWRGR